MTLDPRKEASLVVREVHAGQTGISLMDVDETWLTEVTSSGVSGAELQRALAPVFEKKKAVSSHQRRLAALAGEQQMIGQDQARVRENMKALRGSAEEKPLLHRYTRQLDAQETRLETLREETTRTTASRDSANQELARTISELSFDLPGSR
jgi:predicted RNase H-like nuclease (RuvC/YqgF family)